LVIRKINKQYYKLNFRCFKTCFAGLQASKVLYTHGQKSPYFVWLSLFLTFLLSMQAVSQNSLNDIDEDTPKKNQLESTSWFFDDMFNGITVPIPLLYY